MTQIALACGVFVAAVVALHGMWRPPYGAFVARSGGALAEIVGPERETVAVRGSWLDIERRTAIRQSAHDREAAIAAYPILAVWAWIVIAPRSIGHRLRHALLALVSLALLQAVAVSFEALSAYRYSVAAMGVPLSDGYRFRTTILGALGVGMTNASSHVMPLLLAFFAYPGPRGWGKRPEGAARVP